MYKLTKESIQNKTYKSKKKKKSIREHLDNFVEPIIGINGVTEDQEGIEKYLKKQVNVFQI